MDQFMLPKSLRPWVMLMAMAILVLLVNVDYTAVNIALKKISSELDSNLNTLQWLLSGYILAWAALMVTAGQLADIYGKRRLLLIGICLFSLSSLWCGLAQSESVLIAGRFAQGFGGALFVPPLYTISFSVFPEEKQGMAMGILGAGAGIGLTLGPTFGGALIEYMDWRWIFLVNVPVCLLIMFVTMLCVEKDLVAPDKKLDLWGGFQLGIALFLVVYGLNEIEEWGFFSSGAWSLIGSGAFLLVYFFYSSSKKEYPLIPLGFFSNKPFIGCIFGNAVVEMVFSVIIVMMGLFLQNVREFSAYESGLMFLAMTISYGALSPIGGKMVDSHNARVPASIGVLIIALGMVIALFLNIQSSVYLIIMSLLFVGMGFGISIPAFNATMMKVTKPQMLNTAAGVFTMTTNLGGSLGVVLSTSLLIVLGNPLLVEKSIENNMNLTSSQLENLLHVFGSAYRNMELIADMDMPLATKLMNESFVMANWWITFTSIILCLFVAIVSYKTISISKSSFSQKN